MIVIFTIILIIAIILIIIFTIGRGRPTLRPIVVVDQPFWRYSHPYWYGGYGGRGYGRRCPYGLCRYY